jgi:hypothetical protein
MRIYEHPHPVRSGRFGRVSKDESNRKDLHRYCNGPASSGHDARE